MEHNTHRHPRRFPVVGLRRFLIGLAAGALFASLNPASANEIAVAPDVGLGQLPRLGSEWQAANPYRGTAAAAEAQTLGRAAYNGACARCHGADASTNAAPAPDLRNLDRSCRRIADAELKAWCQRDNDAYFIKSVRQGKVILGITHMPPWEGVLKQELAWAIQVFIESRLSGTR